MTEKLAQLVAKALVEIAKAADSRALYDIKVRYLGKQGELSLIMKDVGQIPKEQRPEFGKVVNVKKTELETAFATREQELKGQELSAKISSEKLDLTLPGPWRSFGTRHPI